MDLTVENPVPGANWSCIKKHPGFIILKNKQTNHPALPPGDIIQPIVMETIKLSDFPITLAACALLKHQGAGKAFYDNGKLRVPKLPVGLALRECSATKVWKIPED